MSTRSQLLTRSPPPQRLAPGQCLLDSLRIGISLRPFRAQQTADSLGLSDGDAQRGHPLLVPGAGHQTLQLVVVENCALRNGANLRDGHAAEAVALSVAAGNGAQVAGDLCRLGLVGQLDQGGAHGIGRGENRMNSCRCFRSHYEDPAILRTVGAGEWRMAATPIDCSHAESG